MALKANLADLHEFARELLPYELSCLFCCFRNGLSHGLDFFVHADLLVPRAVPHDSCFSRLSEEMAEKLAIQTVTFLKCPHGGFLNAAGKSAAVSVLLATRTLHKEVAELIL